MKIGTLFPLLLTVLLLSAMDARGQVPVYAWGSADPLEAEFVNRPSLVEAPVIRGGAAVSAEFVATFRGVPAEMRTAAGNALAIWSTHIVSPIPIKVLIEWVPFERTVLGAAAPRLIANFDGAPDRDTFFPTALASALAGYDTNPDEPDIHVQLNSAFENWYLGLEDILPENTFDPLTVILHEIGHGLGLVGSMHLSGNIGSWGRGPQSWPIVYDRFAETSYTGSIISLLDRITFPSPSILLGNVLQSGTVYWGGSTSMAAHQESQSAQNLEVGPFGRAKLHAPEEWRAGSSFSHLTEETIGEGDDAYQPYYPAGSQNALMTPRLAATEVIRTPGPITCGILKDMGWTPGDQCAALLPEMEVPEDDSFIISSACPNPVQSGIVRVGVHVQEMTFVQADVYDVLGRRVRQLHEARLLPSTPDDSPHCGPGLGSIAVDTSSLSSGVYFLRLIVGGKQETVRFTVVN